MVTLAFFERLRWVLKFLVITIALCLVITIVFCCMECACFLQVIVITIDVGLPASVSE